MKNKNSIPIVTQRKASSFYLQRRATTLSSLRRLTKKLGFTNKAYYQAMLYMDNILANNPTFILKVDLAAISCLLLAGKHLVNIF